MDINLTGQLWGMPVDLMGDAATEWYFNPAWWQVIASVIIGGLTVYIAWRKLGKLDSSVAKVDESIKKIDKTIQLEGGVYTITGGKAKMSIHYTAESIRKRYDDEKMDVKEIIGVMHDSLIDRADKIDKKTLKPLVDATTEIVAKIDDEQDKSKRKQ